MWGNVFLDCLFLFLICYAIVSIFYNVSDFLLRRYCRYPMQAFFMLEITHESKTIECDVRVALSKSIKNKCALMIVCEGLDLDEYTVIWRLTDSFDHVIVTTPDEIMTKIDTAKSINVSQ